MSHPSGRMRPDTQMVHDVESGLDHRFGHSQCFSVRPEVSKGERASFMLRYLGTNGYGPAETMIKALKATGATCILCKYVLITSLNHNRLPRVGELSLSWTGGQASTIYPGVFRGLLDWDKVSGKVPIWLPSVARIIGACGEPGARLPPPSFSPFTWNVPPT
jgi:hypothetical protein